MTETETKWAERVRTWRESGKRVEDFAEGQPYKASTLRWWGMRLRRRVKEDGGLGSPSSKSIPMARVVRRAGPRAQEFKLGAGTAMVVEISGARITLARGFDAELLSEVVRVLGGAR